MEYYFTYFIVFKSNENGFSGPIVLFRNLESVKKNTNGTMHLLDDDLNGTLGAIEYIMHLPRNEFDVYDLDEEFMASSYDTPHQIVLVPDYVLVNLKIDNIAPTMFILTEDCSKDIKNNCEKRKPLLGTYYTHELSQELIKKQWEKIWLSKRTNDFEFEAVKDINIHFRLEGEKLKALPALYISRQFGKANDLLFEIFNCSEIEKKCIDIQWKNISHLNALISMKKKGITCWDDKVYDDEIVKQMYKFDISVVITFPGIPKSQKKYGLSASILSENEKQAIRIMGVHRAIARGGILMELSCAEEELYKKYGELEQRCKNGTNNKYVWKTFSDLGKLLGSCFNSFQIEVLKRAKDITIFSDFPIGLAILENDEVPLQCYKSISYRPLTPLTRQLQVNYFFESLLGLAEKKNGDVEISIRNMIYENAIAFVDRKINNTINMAMGPRVMLAENISKISYLHYEGNKVNKKYIVWGIKKEDCDIIFSNDIMFNDETKLNHDKQIRKLLEITYKDKNNGLYLGCCGNKVEGYISSENLKGELYLVEFNGTGKWSFGFQGSEKNKIIFEDKKVKLFKDDDKVTFYLAYKKIFEEDTNIDYVWKIVESARRQKHGTMLLFTENALSESERLREAGYQVSVKEMVSARSIEALGEIDGAMLLDQYGRFYMIGVILDGTMPPKGVDKGRGARYNSAVKYSYSHKEEKHLLIIISEDGYFDMINYNYI